MYSQRSPHDGVPVVFLLVIVIPLAIIGALKFASADHRSAEHEFRAWAESISLQHGCREPKIRD